MAERPTDEGLEPEEIEAQEGEELPDREAMSVLPLGDTGTSIPPYGWPEEPEPTT